MSPTKRTNLDVLVLGAGYSGALLALVLARRGLRVRVLERGPLPRLVVGESTRNEQNRMHIELARRYRLPELEALGSYGRLRRSGLPIPTWPKEAFYFLTNPADDSEPRRSLRDAPELMHQTAPWPVGPDYHCRRDALDFQLLCFAIARGASVEIGADVTTVDLSDSDGVRVAYRRDGREYEARARVLVDATGHGSLLARTLDLAVTDPPETRLRSRAIYGHFVGVRRLEEVRVGSAWGGDWPSLPISRDHATQHHMDARGWTWVIPFEDGLTSVGAVLNMDRDSTDHEASTAEQVFARVVMENPALAAMFEEAEPIAPLTRTARLQRSTRRARGHRWLMLPPACGFSDPLLSPGMSVSVAAIARVVEPIAAVAAGRASGETAFREMEDCFRLESEHHTRLQNLLTMSFGDAELFSVVQTLDRLTTHLGGVLTAGRPEGTNPPPLFAAGESAIQELLAGAEERMCSAGARSAPPKGMAPDLRAWISENDAYRFACSRFGNPRHTDVHVHSMAPLVRWTNSVASNDDARVSDFARASAQRWRASLIGLAPRLLLAPFQRLRAPRPARPGNRPAPASRGAFSLALRHIAIQLGLLR